MSNVGKSITSKTEKPADAINTQVTWKQIDWKKVEDIVRRIQTRISKAKQQGKNHLMKRLQYLLVHSFSARALAVRRVSQTNKGKRTPGIDGEVWLSDTQRMKAVMDLNKGPYRSKPLRRIHIPKKNGKTRPLSIPTMYDRAMQALYALALDPIQEATADPNSYGFRIGRSCRDARSQLFLLLSRRNSNEWVLEGDIKGCFDNMSIEWMMNNVEMDFDILLQFLKSGYVFQKKLFPTEKGSPQGGVISPILANIVLNGMEQVIKDEYYGVYCVRYADDYVVTVPNELLGHLVQDMTLDPFLLERGLEKSEEKTHVTSIYKGFDFLGWNFRKYKVEGRQKLIIKPSNDSMKSIRRKIHEIVLEQGKALSQGELITRLNPVLRGWGNYHASEWSHRSFQLIDNYLFRTLFKWALRRHGDKGKKWVVNKYWHRVKTRKWVFCTEDATLVKMTDIKLSRYVKIRGDTNPYIDTEYYRNRQKSRKYERGFLDKEFILG